MTIATRHWDRLGNGGIAFTELGFGAAPLGNLMRAISDADADLLLQSAWDRGLRYFDTAPLYGLGLSETRLNRFLRGKPRDGYVLSTKIGRLFRATTPDRRDGLTKWIDVPSRNEVYDYGYDGTLRSLEFSLERLGIDRVDILYAHDLDLFNHGRQDALDARLAEFMAGGYRALLRLRDEGVIRAFGAGLNEWQPCQWLAERGDFDLFLLAGRYTLLEQGPLDSFFPLCAARGIGIVIGGPYNSGILATGPVPGAMFNYSPAPPDVIEKTRRIAEVCDRHGVRLIDAALRFPLLHPVVVSAIPGTQRMQELDSTIRAVQAAIPAAFWADLKSEGLLRPDAPTGGAA
jgi:D-threo-aldose 1-dehydrogenase